MDVTKTDADWALESNHRTAIPFWYATAKLAPKKLTYGGVDKQLDHQIMDIVSPFCGDLVTQIM
jgi:hypothetical protein